MQLDMGGAIRRLRKQKNISQEVLAQALGVSFQAVSKWETGVSHSQRYDLTTHAYTACSNHKQGEQAYETDHLRIQHGQRLRGAAVR